MRTSKKLAPRVSVDAIFTFRGGTALCCLAVKHGLVYGVNSSTYESCAYERSMRGHRVVFVDNPYRNYDHFKHLAVVKKLRPKYATAVDVMAPDDLPRILDQAAELAQYAENIIVIPKCDVFKDIPSHYVLGYAVPTSHGGTDLPYSAFQGHRVHLLGGSWQQQRDLILNSGMNVVSFDNNHINKIAKDGWYVDNVGREFRLKDTLPMFNRTPWYTCMCLSFAGIRAGVDDAQRTLSVRSLG